MITLTISPSRKETAQLVFAALSECPVKTSSLQNFIFVISLMGVRRSASNTVWGIVF